MYTASDFSLASLENYFGGLSPPKFPVTTGLHQHPDSL